MGDNIRAFPQQRTQRHQELERDEALQDDAYYRFVKSLLLDAARSGLVLPRSLEASSQRMYAKNHANDLIGRMLHQNEDDTT